MGHGAMSCGMKLVRLIMALFNIVFFLIGVALLALGIYVMVDPKLQKLKEFLPTSTSSEVQKSLSYIEVLGIVLIVLGSVLLIIGFLGCCGAMKQVKLFLTCYGIIIAIIIIVEIALAIYFVVFQKNFKESVVPKLQDVIKKQYEGPIGLIDNNQPKPSPVSLAWDFVMYNFKCCGVESKTDFLQATKWNRTNPWWNSSLPNNLRTFTYPLTCCPLGNGKQNWNNLPLEQLKTAVECAATGTNVYQTGCYNKIVDLLNSAKNWVIVVAVVVLVIELLAFIFTMALCCRERKGIYYSS